jgi:hypothetical protein
VFSRNKDRRPTITPSDDQIAQEIRVQAEAFVGAMAELGHVLGYEIETVRRLDPLADLLL